MRIEATVAAWKVFRALVIDEKISYSGITGRVAREFVASLDALLAVGDGGLLSLQVNEMEKKFIRELDNQIKRPFSLELEVGVIFDQVR